MIKTTSKNLLAVLALLTLQCAQSADGIPRGRLPDDVRPQRYRLELTIDPREQRFSGSATINVEVARQTQVIWLHGLGLSVSRASVESAGAVIAARYSEAEPVTGIARLDLDRPAGPGPAVLHLEYSAAFRTGAEGLFRVQAGEASYVFSQMEAIDARRAFPGFDEPRFKTPFEVTVRARDGDKVVSNAPLRSAVPATDGWMRNEFEPTLPLPTYLVAIAVGPFDVFEAPPMPPSGVRDHPLPLRGIATRGQGPRLAYALQQTPELIRRLEEYFGIAYPYQKLDLIASPQMAGAMENAGAILFSDNLILLNDDAPLQQVRAFGATMAHELAHQWFGDLVTPAWWEDIWLNESFATWIGSKVADQWRPDLSIGTGLTVAALGAMDLDARSAGRPIRQPVDDNTQIASTFDSITYQKGGGVLTMIESYLGEQAFRDGVRLHLQRHRFGSATSNEFFTSMADAAKQPQVLDAFRSFVEQPGVPLLTVRRSSDGSALELSQARYRPIGSSIEAGQQWKIPVCVTAYAAADGKDSKHCTLLTSERSTLPLPAGTVAVMPNAGGAGYYRFSLDAAAIAALTRRAATLPQREAIAFADSMAAGFRAGQVSFADLVKAARALSNHSSRQATTQLAYVLVDIRNRWPDAAMRVRIEALLRDIYGPRLASLGFDPRRGAYATEAADRRLLRRSLVSILALSGRDPALRAQLAAAGRAALTDPSAVDPEYRDTAWAVAVQELDDSFGAALAEKMFSTTDGLTRSHAAGALGAAERQSAVARTFTVATDPRTRASELFAIIGRQFDSPVSRDAAWVWFQANLDSIFNRLPGFAQPFAFGSPEPFCDAGHRAAIEQVLKPRVDALGKGGLELARTLEGIDLCVAQSAKLGVEVAAALK